MVSLQIILLCLRNRSYPKRNGSMLWFHRPVLTAWGSTSIRGRNVSLSKMSFFFQDGGLEALLTCLSHLERQTSVYRFMLWTFVQEATQKLDRKTERNHKPFERSGELQPTLWAKGKTTSPPCVKGGQTASGTYTFPGKPGNPGYRARP